MAKIQKLPREIAQLIAAGEVVERPASVVKELLENAVDAGASEITLEIQNGGIRFIRVTDNGCGIARDDVPTAFLSHATSKIQKADDLNAIFTLGFRGEALASVAAVSRVELMTKTADEFAGTRAVLEGGELLSVADAGCPNGTTLIIRDLFYNTPARMKFLKSDRAEGSAVALIADRIALSHPEISVRFIKEGKQQMCTPGNGDLHACIHAVYGREFAETLLPVEYNLNGIAVRGFVSKPFCSRGSNSMQHFFVNNRYIKSRSGAAALNEAYKNAVMVGKYPACVLFLEVQPSAVDVNVHPAKTEVRFSNEKAVFDAIFYAVKNTLSADRSRPAAVLSHTPATTSRPEKSVLRKAEPTAVQIELEDIPASLAQEPVKQNNFTTINSPANAEKPAKREIQAFRQVLNDTKELYETEELPDLSVRTSAEPVKNGTEETAQTVEIPMPTAEVSASPLDEAVVQPKKAPAFRLIGEAFKAFIFVECDGKLLIIDKHAAHERMLFDALKKDNGKQGAQLLLSPVTVTLSKDEYAVLCENMAVLNEAGFDAEDFGEGAVRVRACPLNLEKEDITVLVTEIAGYLLKNRREVLSEKLDWIYHSLACRAAIKAGNDTKDYELYEFTKKLLQDDSVRYCPHGRPVLIELTRAELDKQFGRIQ
ncbi:MAG: DNA mismatch repair endonuclease MutL [Clostridia bacterium]|nr:DNA mismatch repair endonuclease MutL [Clostridia bacterium]